MLEYCWLFALLLRSARYFPGAEGKWIPLPPMLPPSSKSPKTYLLIMLLQLYHFPPSLHSILYNPSLPRSPPIVHVHGSCIKVLWLLHFLCYSYPPPVYFPPTIYATYSLCLPPLPPTSLLITLHVISISVVLFLF